MFSTVLSETKFVRNRKEFTLAEYCISFCQFVRNRADSFLSEYSSSFCHAVVIILRMCFSTLNFSTHFYS